VEGLDWVYSLRARSSIKVPRHSSLPLPELFEHLNPMPFEAAVPMEKALAGRGQGYHARAGKAPAPTATT